MSAFAGDKKRRVIPRWRDSRVIDASLETTTSSRPSRNPFIDDDVLTERRRDWLEHRDVFFATDLVGAAIAYGKLDLAEDAATFLVKNSEQVPAPALRLARIVLGQEHTEERQDDANGLVREPEEARTLIRGLRASLHRDPRNVLHRVDMARHYAALGLKRHAAAEMKVALWLTPSNRFVLRAANRLLIHIDEKEHALDLLRRTERTKNDPWLMAAEIATSSVNGRVSKFAKQGFRILESRKFHPSQISELASALSTLELESGSTKGCRKLLRVSLESPTDNAVAQAEWIYEQLGDVGAVADHLKVPRSYEARALESTANGKWKEAAEHSKLWLADEPFSSRPALEGSFVTSVALEDYSASERFLRFGIGANPGDVFLRNNLVFTLIGQSRIDDARVEHEAIASECTSGVERVLWLANQGLLEFRRGEIAKGRVSYEQAVTAAKELNDRELAAQAMSFWALEEARIRSDVAPSLLSILEKAPKSLLDLAHLQLIERAKELSERRTLIEQVKGTAADVRRKLGI